MKRPLLVPLGFAFALACTPTEPGTDDSDTSTSGNTNGTDSAESGDTSDTATTMNDTSDTGVEPVATIVGTIVDAQGAPLPSVLNQFCGPIDAEGNVELCIPIPTDESTGEFTINVLEAGLWSLKIVQAPVEGRYFTGQAFQIPVNEGDALDLAPPIVIPETDTVTPLMGPTLVTIDDVLSLTVDPAMAMSPDFVPPSELGGIAPPQEHWRVTEVEGSPVIAAWSFTPFGIKSTMGGFGFSINGNLGLAADEAVVFWEIEKDNGSIHEIATGTVNGDASAIDVLPTGEGLHELTWLLVTQ